MTDIQRARDILQRLRDDSDGSSPGTWAIDASGSIFPTIRDTNRGEVATSLLSEDARLIVGTAGNPDLLDAIDALLAAMIPWREAGLSTEFLMRAERIAAAIITADERMNA